MKYGLCKKITFLLCEYFYDKRNRELEDELCEAIHDLEQENWWDLKSNFDECIQVLQNIPAEYDFCKPYSWVENVDDLINYLRYLPVSIGEDQAEREIARAEALADYLYEEGYDEFMLYGFDG